MAGDTRIPGVDAPHLEGFDPTSARVRADPFPAYRWLREHAPVYKIPGHPMWVLSRYEDVDRALRDHRLFSSDVGVPAPVLSLILMDPPDHERLRRTITRAFTWRRVQELEPRVRTISEKLVAELPERCDFIDAFSSPLPSTVICEMLGIDSYEPRELRRWSREALRLGVPTGGVSSPTQRSAEDAPIELVEFIEGVVAERRRRPRADLLSDLVRLEREGVLAPQEVVYFCTLMVIAGDETSANMISAGARILAEREDLWNRLRRDPQLLPRFVEEVLRYESPLQRVIRRTTRSTQIVGSRIPAGSHVMLLLGSANRDGRRFEAPDVFDPDRNPSGHLAFSGGIHSCLGASLARLEGVVAFETLLRRVHRLRPDPDREPVRITDYGAGNFGWEVLPLRVERQPG